MQVEQYKNIPISEATKLLEGYSKDEIIIIAWDSKHNRVHLTTDGSNEEHKANAAKGSIAITKHLQKIGTISGEAEIFEDPNKRLSQ